MDIALIMAAVNSSSLDNYAPWLQATSDGNLEEAGANTGGSLVKIG